MNTGKEGSTQICTSSLPGPHADAPKNDSPLLWPEHHGRESAFNKMVVRADKIEPLQVPEMYHQSSLQDL